MSCIRISLSSGERGRSINATLIASILRRTEAPVHVRCWCRGFLPESFETVALKVEFIPAAEEVTGTYPGSSGPAAYDRLLAIRDCPDWDRCMVMDCDQLALCDLAPLFFLELGDHLLAAHMQGPGVDMDYAMRVWLKRPIPEGWEHVGTHPYFLMPPLLNLKAMREAGTWETFLAAHAAFGADDQLSLTAATEGRSLPLERKWNLFPKLHIKEDEVPEGIIHWSGWPKPWHRDAKVWRPDIWESEKSSWEHLRMGIWRKPLAIELEPDDERGMRALAQRGWRVRVFSGWEENDGHRPTLQDGFPDLTFFLTADRRMLEDEAPSAVTGAVAVVFLESGRKVEGVRGKERGSAEGCRGDAGIGGATLPKKLRNVSAEAWGQWERGCVPGIGGACVGRSPVSALRATPYKWHPPSLSGAAAGAWGFAQRRCEEFSLQHPREILLRCGKCPGNLPRTKAAWRNW